MEPWKIKGILQQAILKESPEIVLKLLPLEENDEDIEIFMSLSDIRYNGIETKEAVVKLSRKGRDPFILFSRYISSIKCP